MIMGFLMRLLPYARVIGIAAAAAILFAGVMYIRHLWIEAEIAQRSYQQAVEQLNSVTRELEQEQARREQENQRVDKAEKEAAEIDDADDSAPESTKHLLNELYGD